MLPMKFLPALAIGCLIASSASAVDRPNVMLILADDLGYGDIGVHGCTDIPTPNIDSLAADGVRFTNGYSSHPFCSPMRAGLMACRYQHRFGYVTNVAFDPHNQQMGLPTSETTIAKRLTSAGYRTGMVGKWHLGAHANFHPMKRGFEFFYGFLGGGHDYFRVDTTVALNENYRAALDDNGKPTSFDGYLTDALTDKALEFLSQQTDGQPYFLYVAYNAPHGPLQAPKRKLDQFKSIPNNKRRTYAAMVSAMDDQIGRLLNEIDRRGERESTLVFFLSDNGGPEHANASDNGQLRGQKGDVWEGGIRVPFLMRMPGTIPAGAIYEKPVISLDVSRTALHVAGINVSPDDPVEGVNLIPHVNGAKTDAPHDALFWRMQFDAQWAVRSGSRKLVRRPEGLSLYDLNADVSESMDLARQQATTVSQLRTKFDGWTRTNQPARFPGYRDYHKTLKQIHRDIQTAAQNDDRSDR
ncbi:MAG: sulfatase-like hydrolase/transferase [Planctomycetota bacterium]